MIRRGVCALLVIVVVLVHAAPAHAQQPARGRTRVDKIILWTVIGVAGGAAAAYWAGHYAYKDTRQGYRKVLGTTLAGGGVGGAIGFTLGLRANAGPYYVQVAEGLSSPTLTEGIRVAPRLFSASQLVEACKDPRIVERLDVAPNPLEMREDGRYALNTLSVVAINGADVAMANVPIVLEAEEVSPPVVQLRSDDPDINAGRLHALRTGLFQMRIRTMCGTPHVEKIILGRVSP